MDQGCELRLYGLSKRLQLNSLHDGEVTSSPPDYFWTRIVDPCQQQQTKKPADFNNTQQIIQTQ